MYWLAVCLALFLLSSLLATYCWRGKKLGKDVAIAVLVRMPRGMKQHAGEYKNSHIVPAIISSDKRSSIIHTGLVEMTYCGAEVWDSVTIGYFPTKDAAEVALASISRAERAFNQSRGLADPPAQLQRGGVAEGPSRHDRLAAPQSMAAMQQMSYAPAAGAAPVTEESVGPKKRGGFTTDSLLAARVQNGGVEVGSEGGAGVGLRDEEVGERKEVDESDGEVGRNGLLETQLIPLQPQPPIATFVYDIILHRIFGWFYRKAAEVDTKKKKDDAYDDDEDLPMGHNPVVPPPQFAFLLPNPRQRAQIKALAAQNRGPIVMINLVQLLDDASELEYMQYAMKVSVFLLPQLDGKVVFQGPCMAGSWSSISCIQYGEGEAGVIKLEDMPFYHECHLHRENSLRHTVML
eukprot:CAMPEP_0114619544 /NCGR_PEP_ID=MMETSP0168-20121206/8267_1 /TAXON_ID=95228 ORGANISM="Vannella sp., Strain DIVA3 517/6/12" /NCGR_SAMPLE_ID=MMETSP0168 /ASSEMBLY_ACC=CAM_ASM_000044 /LENGTH=404 /DNA_ID=CAMNT_0001830713 /DNA_START=134 /DNA_END=1344 /DNA_ORIENTATION=-